MMPNAQLEEDCGKALMRQWLLWGAMSFSVLIYALLGYFLQGRVQLQVDPAMVELASTLEVVAWVVGGSMLLVPRLVRRWLLGRSCANTPPGATLSSSVPGFVARSTTALVMALALSDVTAILGLVLFFIGQSYETLLLFIALSFAAMLLNTPSRDELERLALQSVAGATNTYGP